MRFLKSLLLCLFWTPIFAQQLAISSGSGQIVLEQFPAKPLVVCATGAGGAPVPNLPVTWTVPAREGTINSSDAATDASGCATARFLATSIQPGTSYAQTTVVASSSIGSVSFYITTSSNRLSESPQVQIVNANPITAPAASTVQNAFTVVVVAGGGIRLGQGIPNIGVRAAFGTGVDPTTAPGGTCDAQFGIVYTDATGKATCNLKLNGNLGTGGVYASVGDYVTIPNSGIPLTITPASTCNVALNPSTMTFGGGGGAGSFAVSSSCGWTVTKNADWITLQSSSSGNGNGTVTFVVNANSGTARTGTITVNNATFTITQSALGSAGPLAFNAAASLPQATVGQAYSTTLGATGGQPPYVWSGTGLPAGLKKEQKKKR